MNVVQLENGLIILNLKIYIYIYTRSPNYINILNIYLNIPTNTVAFCEHSFSTL